MRILAKRKVQIYSYSVQMSVFYKEKKPELVPILQAIKEANDLDEEVIEYINDKIFPGLPISFIQNILQELHLLELVEKDFTLTDQALQSIEDGDIPIPNRGVFEIKAVNDLYVPQIIIQIRQLNPNLQNEMRNKQDPSLKRVDIPEYIQMMKNVHVKTLEDNPQNLVIHDIDFKGSLNTKYKTKLELVLISENKKWNLKGKIGNKSYPIHLPEFFKEEKATDEFLQKISTNADLKTWRIPQNPDDLEKSELLSFKKTFRLSEVSILSIGKFESILIQDVEVFPDNVENAQKWIDFLLIEQISEYLTENKYNELWESIIDKNPCFRDFNLESPSIETILNDVEFASSKYWFIRTPLDFKLLEVEE